MKKTAFIIFTLVTLFALALPNAVLANTFTVTKTDDTNDGTCDDDCSLREAIAAANSNSGEDIIEFNISYDDDNYENDSDTWTITLSNILTISENQDLIIDGSSQVGQTNLPEYGGHIVILRSGNMRMITGSSTSDLSLKHLTFKNTGTVTQSPMIGGTHGDVLIENSHFTRDTHLFQNNDVLSFSSTQNITIKNNKFDSFNRAITVTSNQSDKSIVIDSNVIENANSIAMRPSGYNMSITDNTITGKSDQTIISTCNGGTCTISGNTIDEPTSESWAAVIARGSNGKHIIKNNTIKTNHFQALRVETEATVESNTIDGKIVIRTGNESKPVTVSNNNITANGSNSVQPFLIELDDTKAAITNNVLTSSLPNTIINIKGGDENNLGITSNDPEDTDTGPNDLMNYPIIQHAEWRGGGTYKVWGYLDGNPSEAPFTIEVCKSSNHSSGHGGCIEPLGTTTTKDGNWELTVSISEDSEDSLSTFTALATNNSGSTSEFSPNLSGTRPGFPTTLQQNGPELVAFQGGVVEKHEAHSILLPGTFLYDVYLSVEKTINDGSYRIPTTNYWQASDIFEIWWRSYFNHARILASEAQLPYIITLRYSDEDLDPSLPEENLKLAYSKDDGNSWRVLPNSVLDMENNTVAVVTTEGGMFMLVSGYHN